MDKNNFKQEDLLSLGYGMIPKLVMKDRGLTVEAKVYTHIYVLIAEPEIRLFHP